MKVILIYVWFQQEDVPPHYTCNVRLFVDEYLPEKWIVRPQNLNEVKNRIGAETPNSITTGARTWLDSLSLSLFQHLLWPQHLMCF